MRSDSPVAAFAVLLAAAASAQTIHFDINDAATASPTQAAWIGVGGATDNADTITGTDGTYTLTLTTSGDGQDRDRGTSGFTTDVALWRDFWFVADSGVSGATAGATVSGLAANTDYTVRIWAFDAPSTGNRSAVWQDPVSGNSATLSFNGSTTPRPTSLDDSVATLTARTNASGVLSLNAVASATGAVGNPNIFINGLSVAPTDDPTDPTDPSGPILLPAAEAEAGTLGADFAVLTQNGVAGIGITSTTGGNNPGSAARVATYTITFPAADTYQLHARIYIGPGSFNDDSLFYAGSFGAKSPTANADWITVNGLVDFGFTAPEDTVMVNSGPARTQVWKWIKLPTFYPVPEGALTQTFQIGGREDGLLIDKLVFGPIDLALTVADLDSGLLPEPDLSSNTFEGPDGLALARFDEPLRGLTADGANPAGGLILLGDALYGAAQHGGLQGDGTLYRLDLDGANFEVLRTLSASANIGHPQGGLVASGTGFVGAAPAGGLQGVGAVFSSQTDGTVTLLHSFAALTNHTATNSGGASPSGPLVVAGNTIHGVATYGGTNGNGTLFSVSTTGTGFTVRHHFSATSAATGTNADGARPQGGLIQVGTTLYGATSAGGADGAGVVFAYNLATGTRTTLHAFAALDPVSGINADGAFPAGGLVAMDDRLYGVTLAGGTGGGGTIFSLGLDGSDFTVRHDFAALDPATGTNATGASPGASLFRSGNLLYGTTSAGGTGGAGTIFALDVAEATFRTLHHFAPLAADGTNRYGACPIAPVLRVGNSLYGTAFAGGPGGSGTVFSIPLPVDTHAGAAPRLDGGVDLTFAGQGAPAASYTIEATDELATTPESWETVTTVEADASGRWEFVEPHPTPPAKRFYRAVHDR